MRERLGLTECSNYAKYRLNGDGAAEWLQGLFTNRLPQVGRIAPTPMLNPEGRIVGEFSIARVDDDDFFLFGSQAAEVHHSAGSSPTCRSARRSASTCSGSRSSGCRSPGRAREVLQSVTAESWRQPTSFMSFRRIDVGMIPARVVRMTYTGDLGYELWVAPEHQRALFDLLWDAGQDGIALFGFRALMSLRMEKMFGTWMREYRPIYSPLEAPGPLPQARPRLHRGAALETERQRGPQRSLVYLEI